MNSPSPSPKNSSMAAAVNAMAWDRAVQNALLQAETRKYTSNISSQSSLSPSSQLLLENSRAFVASREQTAHRKKRQQAAATSAARIAEITAAVSSISTSEDWNVESQQVRSKVFRAKQEKLGRIGDKQGCHRYEKEPLQTVALQEGIWPSSDLVITDNLPVEIIPVLPVSGATMKYAPVPNPLSHQPGSLTH